MIRYGDEYANSPRYLKASFLVGGAFDRRLICQTLGGCIRVTGKSKLGDTMSGFVLVPFSSFTVPRVLLVSSVHRPLVSPTQSAPQRQ